MRMINSGCMLLFSLTVFGYSVNAVDIDVPTVPVAEKIPHIDTVHGDIRVDNYYWLRQRDDPAVIAYLRAENDYTVAMMKDTERLQDSLYREMLSRIKETDLSVPMKLDGYYYYSRTEEGMEYPIYCRKKGSIDSPEQVLLDLNELAKAYSYLELGAYELSPSHRYLAYSIDTSGAERYTMYIKDLDKDSLLGEMIANVSYQAAWLNDDRTIYYTVLDEAKRPYKLCMHKLGTPAYLDSVMYHEGDEAYWIDVRKTKSEQYILMNTSSHTTTEFWYCDADAPELGFEVFQPRRQDVEYYIDHRADKFYVMTNDNAMNFKLMETTVEKPAVADWREVIPHRDSVMITNFEVFENYVVVYEREKGLERIRIIDMVRNLDYHIVFDEPVYTLWAARNPEYKTDLLRFEYTSLKTPRTIFDYNMKTRSRELKKQYEVMGGYDPDQYTSERVFARTAEGTTIPISIVYKKGMKKNGRNGLLLTAYGAYGFSSEAYFSPNRLSLLDRGIVYAIAHVRGGGEMGKSWHRQGQFLNKMNTFSDFISCAEYLVDNSYTKKERLVISGGSAGGLLMGAVANMRPDLFKAIVADVPFVDVINTLLDSTIPLTVVEYTELGSPYEWDFYEYMKTYSPYDNVVSGDYPNMLIVANFNDTRVQYWEPTKWVAKLRDMKTDDNLLLLKINMDAGHEGASGRYGYLRYVAFEYAFILKALELTE